MPIQEAYKKEALSKVEYLRDKLKAILEEVIASLDSDDIEMGVSETISVDEDLWKTSVEDNNYMEVVFTEIMEHHDGAYLKATFRNSVENAYADRYVSIRSSGRVEITYAFFVMISNIVARVEKKPDGRFTVFIKTA